MQTISQENNIIIDDFSNLNSTHVYQIKTPESYQELQDIAYYASVHNFKITVAGSRHSQGGHAFYPGGIIINLQKLNKILDFKQKEKLITVQAGATWDQVQLFLHDYGCAIKIMQYANIFTLGGSLSVNCNGIDPNYGPIIESVESIKILQADGKIVRASRFENSELFSLAIGGYGLFGIILEATLHVVTDDLYKFQMKTASLTSYIKTIKSIQNSCELGFHFAFLTLTPFKERLFGKIVYLNFAKIDDTLLSEKKQKNIKKLQSYHYTNIKKFGVKLWSKSKIIKTLHWIPEVKKYANIVSRNNIMRPFVDHMYLDSKTSTLLLQEYFIPIDQFVQFINALEYITKKFNINIMHVQLRLIPKNTESYLSYTTTDRIGIVILIHQNFTDQDSKKTQEWTKNLIQEAYVRGGSYYLPIQLHATNDQILQIYPQLHLFFALKKMYDPNELFMNLFYEKYAIQ
jgi:FAD/FMN-containing dehydrogenase